jgi:lipopolysaccharide/colanic/teichoic acid biosynthesis glycosyltransferase
MLKLKSRQIWLFIGDITVSAISLYIVLTIRFLDLPTEERIFLHAEIFIPLIVITVALYYSFNFYELSPFKNLYRQFSQLINIHTFVALIGFGYFYLFSQYTGITPKTVLVLYTLIHIGVAALWRLFFAPLFFKPTQRAKALLVAEGEEYEELKTVVNGHTFYPFSFVSHLDITPEDVSTGSNILEKLKSILEENNISQVVIDIRDQKVAVLLPYLYNLASQRKIDVFDVTMVYQDVLKKMPMRGIGHFWFFESVHLNIGSYEKAKRMMDVVVAFPILVVYALILPFIYLAIKLDDGGPLLSIQRRYGRGGKVLKIYKIRTMDFTDEGEWVKHNKLNKVTRVGAFLRRSRLDEFPQLWNVLLGDVSLVGPRSDILANGGKLSAQIEYYMMRYTVPPGLSGWAQVNQELPPNSLEETKVRLQYDLYYVKNRSLLLDFIIMVKTFRVLVMRTGL